MNKHFMTFTENTPKESQVFLSVPLDNKQMGLVVNYQPCQGVNCVNILEKDRSRLKTKQRLS